MLDCETLSTTPEATILQIAAIQFNPFGDASCVEDLLSNPFLNLLIEIDTQDRHIDEATVSWWGKQSQKVQDIMFAETGRISLTDGLKQLSKFVWNKDKIWAQGSAFDIPILENACMQLKLPLPWEFWKVRDSRTLLDLVDVELPKATHDAVIDCARQAFGVQEALRKLNVTRFQR